jgi:hypothetical protein
VAGLLVAGRVFKGLLFLPTSSLAKIPDFGDIDQ